MSVERHEPRKSRIISAVSAAASVASVSSPSMACSTNPDASASTSTRVPSGAAALMVGSIAFTRLATSSVEASPFFITVSTTLRRPSARAMFVCT